MNKLDAETRFRMGLPPEGVKENLCCVACYNGVLHVDVGDRIRCHGEYILIVEYSECGTCPPKHA